MGSSRAEKETTRKSYAKFVNRSKISKKRQVSPIVDQVLQAPLLTKFHYRRIKHERCTRCGTLGHLANARYCPARNAKCRKCGLQGHFEFYCRTRQAKRPAPYKVTDNRHKRFKSGINLVEADRSDPEPHHTEGNIRNFECFKINDSSKTNYPTTQDELIECLVGGVPKTFLIDSGCKVNIIQGDDWEILTQKEAVT